jgi:hypothetical protein
MALIEGLGKSPEVPQRLTPLLEMRRKPKRTHSRGEKRNTGEIGYALAVPQDLADMVKATLLELQCSEEFNPSEGKAYQR